MSGFSAELDINKLATLLPSWNKIIAEDLVREIERDSRKGRKRFRRCACFSQ